MLKARGKTPYIIGYLSLGYAISKKLLINIVSFDGVEPPVTNILNGKNKVIRPMNIVYKKLSARIKKIIKILLNPVAKEIMVKNGFAPYQNK